MKVITFEEEGNREAWLNARLGKLTGSRVKDALTLKGDGIKTDAWALVAESLIGSAALAEDEKPMDRGTRLEPEAIARFVKETGKEVDTSLLMWVRDDDERIAISPDGVIGKTEAVEVKCLSAAKHVEAMTTGRIPQNTAGYEEQALQYFIVNDKLKTLYFVFYDPRFPSGLDYYCIEMKRKDREAEIREYMDREKELLRWVRSTVNKLTFYSPEELRAAEQHRQELLSTQHEAAASIAIEIEEKAASKRALARVAGGIKERS